MNGERLGARGSGSPDTTVGGCEPRPALQVVAGDASGKNELEVRERVIR
jgi:hypothetical protein